MTKDATSGVLGLPSNASEALILVPCLNGVLSALNARQPCPAIVGKMSFVKAKPV